MATSGGYPLRQRRDGWWEQTAPTHCPRGHELKPPNVLVGYGPSTMSAKRMLKWECQTCGSTVWKDGSEKVTGQD
jgi:hypothetical protein